MIGVRWRKVVRDLTHLRARTALVVLSIAIGVFAVGTIAGSQAALDASLRDGYERAQSANLIVYTTVPFDEGLVDSIRRIPGVGIAEGRRTVSVRVRTGETWRELQLTGAGRTAADRNLQAHCLAPGFRQDASRRKRTWRTRRSWNW